MVKIFSFLDSLSGKEIKQFQRFIASPSYNKRVDVQRLLEYWMNHQRHFSKEKAFKNVFDGKEFHAPSWHLVMSRLFKLGEQFLAINEMLQDNTATQIFLMKAYRKKKLERFFYLTIKETQKHQDKQTLRNTDWLQNQFYIESEFYDYIASHDRKNKTNLQTVNDTLDKYFFANKLKTACLAIARNTINQEEYEISMLQDVLAKVETSPLLLEEPSIGMYYYCYKAITDSVGEQWFTLLRKAMANYKSCFPPSERRDILLLAINYCIRRLNTGSSVFVREALELYRLSLSEGSLLEDGVLPESTFNNIVTLAAKLKEFTWANDFVHQNQQYLKSIFREPLYFYSLGKLFYEQGRYDESLINLAKVETKTSFLMLGAKTLQLKIFYEQNEINALESLLESLRIYLQRRNDLGYRKPNYENLIFFVKKLLEKNAMSRIEKQKFIEEVNAAEIFTEKEWMLKQLS